VELVKAIGLGPSELLIIVALSSGYYAESLVYSKCVTYEARLLPILTFRS